MTTATARTAKAFKGVGMEGPIASWYAKNTASALPEFHALAARVASEVDRGDWVLEVAPGPGYLAVELARLGLRVSAVDISRAFVRITADNAGKSGVAVDVRQGDVSAMPFEAERFDFVVCRAAFKNFSRPVEALQEIRRVLRPKGHALIIDMRREASNSEIAAEVAKMRLGRMDALITRGALRSLRRRAYTAADFVRMIGKAGFSASHIAPSPIGFDIRLTK